MRDPEFWISIRKSGYDVAGRMLERLQARLGRPLSSTEEMNVRFAFQMTASVINNAIINRPGPAFIGQSDFLENLTRAFRLVCDYDRLLSESRPESRGSRRIRNKPGALPAPLRQPARARQALRR
jgi:hypothetical protein